MSAAAVQMLKTDKSKSIDSFSQNTFPCNSKRGFFVFRPQKPLIGVHSLCGYSTLENHPPLPQLLSH